MTVLRVFGLVFIGSLLVINIVVLATGTSERLWLTLLAIVFCSASVALNIVGIYRNERRVADASREAVKP